MNDIESKLIDKYGRGRESIKDLDEALNLLNIYGAGECELCFHKSIRDQVYKQFTNDSLEKLHIHQAVDK